MGKKVATLDEYKYKPPVKDTRYGKPKIKIVQDINAHNHNQKHPLNIFFNQYNEFIRLVLSKTEKKKSKEEPSLGYLLGLSRAIGLNLKPLDLEKNNLS